MCFLPAVHVSLNLKINSLSLRPSSAWFVSLIFNCEFKFIEKFKSPKRVWFNGAGRSENPKTYWFLTGVFAVSTEDMPSSLYLPSIGSPKSRNFRLRCRSFACLPQQQKLDQQPLRHGKTLKIFNLKSKIYLFMFSFFLFLCSDYWNLLLLLSLRRLSSRLSLKASVQTFFQLPPFRLPSAHFPFSMLCV